uniref:type 3 dihydrofolate reductase n=1 Tax=Ningiella ruwaisensis TaxID=2364274 RepID=UPI0010A01B8F|nr:type 3 dihydrofolate reductase [Ningiella ruwaisensis]
MKISLIAAMAKNRVIGKDNEMPWHLPADLKHFKSVTMGLPVIMGRKTYESIGKALPGRENIVISRNKSYQLNDACVVPNAEDALAVAQKTANEVMVIGGGKIYELFLPEAQQLFLTFIDLDVEGDTQFPDWTANANWKEIESHSHKKDDKNPYDYKFVTLARE